MKSIFRIVALAAFFVAVYASATTPVQYAPATLTPSCLAVTTTGQCTPLALAGNSLAIGVTWQITYGNAGTASSLSATLIGSNDNVTWSAALDTNTTCLTTGNSACTRSLTVTAYKYLACSIGTYSIGTTNNLSCSLTVNPNGGTPIGIHGTITPGDCVEWFNATTLEDAGTVCSGGSSGTVTSVTCGAGLSGGTITTSGTCAVIAASGASNYPLCSAVSGGLPSSGICTVTVTNAQLLALGAASWTPLQIFPAQGSGLFPDIDYVMMEYVCNSCTPMTLTGTTQLEIYWVDTSNDTFAGVANIGFLDQSVSNSVAWINLFVSQIGQGSPEGEPTPLPSGILSNANVLLACKAEGSCSTNNKWASGTGSLFLTISYHIDSIK
jgi:hypothetical protein